MPPPVASLVFTLGIVGLFYLDRDRAARTSWALWLPIIWLAIAASRFVSEWLNAAPLDPNAADQYMEGNPLDRAILTVLVVVGLIVLIARGRRVLQFLRTNWPILLFLLYCAVSIFWSEYPEIALKRWIKALGDFVMVLLVLTDPDRPAAIKQFLGRVGFVLIPTSILLIKYYPEWGRSYDRWEGTQSFTGVGTDKNMLGMMCLVMGLATVWRISHFIRAGKSARKMGPIVAQVSVLAMAIWLLYKANSMTSISSFAAGSLLIVMTSIPKLARKRALIQFTALGMLFFSFSTLFLNLGSGLLKTVGRNPTLTGRTELWALLFHMVQNPIIGTGFGSFWLGSRLAYLWNIYWWHPNESHNGYIEIFLNLGWIGITLLGLILIAGYRNAMRLLRVDPEAGRFALAYFVAAVMYNFTEAGFKTMNPVWIAFLLVVMVAPRTQAANAPKAPASKTRRIPAPKQSVASVEAV